MPSTSVRGGLYWSDHTKTWHYEFRRQGRKYNGDTGIGSTRDLATKWLLKFKETLAARRVGLELAQEVPTLREALEAWEEANHGVVEPRHIVNMRCAILEHCKRALQLPLNEIDNETVETIRTAYLNSKGRGYRTGQTWEAEREHSSGGANTVVKMLSSLIGWAIARKTMGIQSRPFKLTALRAHERPEGIIWPERVQEAITEADKGGYDWASDKPDKNPPHSATAIRLMLGLGLRESEALRARWEHLDLRRQVYIVSKTKNRKLREVPVPAWLLKHLESIRPTDVKRGLVLPAESNPDGTQLQHHKTFTAKSVDRIAVNLEIEGLTPHRLRATFATTHYEAGTPLSQIQQMMGHSDPATTMKYIVQRPKDQASAQNRVAELMGFTSSPPQVPEPTRPKKPKKDNKRDE